jgi:2-iminobutanoate/2-iminopropanoate deaminase
MTDKSSGAVDVAGLTAGGAGWSQVTVHRDLVFVSGQVAWDADGGIVGRSAAEQAEQAFANLERALQAAGSSMAQILKVIVYLTSVDELAAVRAVRDRWLGSARPASTLVAVAHLVEPELLFEIEAVAYRHEPD